MMESHQHVHLPSSLEKAKIQGLPHTAFYIPDFISHDEEQAILSKVGCETLWPSLSLLADSLGRHM
jgi:hypothetical protein